VSKEKKFTFHVPIELIKGQESEETWKVRGIASTEDQDLQGESVMQEGLDISALKAGRGLFNWDHQKGPENVLGQIEDAEFISYDGKKALQVEGYLFKHQEKAKAFYNILKSLKKGAGPRVHMSIEGKILERDNFNAQKIKKARIDKVALTLDPVNPYTFAELCKSLNAPDESGGVEEQVVDNTPEMVEIEKEKLEKLIEVAQKAMSAGAGNAKAPTARTGGEAMVPESLEKQPKSVTYDKKMKKTSKEMVKSIIESMLEAHPNHDPIELAQWVVESFLQKSKGESRD